MTVRAIFEDGVFKPSSVVALPDHAEVELEIAQVNTRGRECLGAVPSLPDILRMRYDSSVLPTDLAARHNEHLP